MDPGFKLLLWIIVSIVFFIGSIIISVAIIRWVFRIDDIINLLEDIRAGRKHHLSETSLPLPSVQPPIAEQGIIKIQCSQCRSVVEVPAEYAGKEIKCPKCYRQFICKLY